MKKVHIVINFIQNAWLKPYIDMKADLRKKEKNDFNNAVFGKTMENVRKHRYIKLVTTERRRNYLVLEPNYHTKKFFTENMLVIEIKKNRDTYEQACPILSILEFRKTLMYEFWKRKIKI